MFSNKLIHHENKTNKSKDLPIIFVNGYGLCGNRG